MDYLITEGYSAAAKKFAAEANLVPQGTTMSDPTNIEKRVEIRNAILSGDIQHAIEEINELNQDVRTLSTFPNPLLAMIRHCFMHHSYASACDERQYTFSPQNEHYSQRITLHRTTSATQANQYRTIVARGRSSSSLCTASTTAH